MTDAERAELDHPTRCPYCGAGVSLQSSTIVYGGRDFGMIYVCDQHPTCDAYVGVHRDTDRAKGRLANAELRCWKIRAHEAFDALWKGGAMTRKDASKLPRSGADIAVYRGTRSRRSRSSARAVAIERRLMR